MEFLSNKTYISEVPNYVLFYIFLHILKCLTVRLNY